VEPEGVGSKSSLLTLPNELLFEVASNLELFSDLNSLVCTSRFFHATFNPLLYRRALTFPNDAFERDDIIDWALNQEEATTLEHLLDNGLSPNYVIYKESGQGGPMLRQMCHKIYGQYSLVPVAELLVDRGAFIEEEGYQTILHAAARAGNFAMAELMLQLGTDVDAPACDGRTPLHYAVQSSVEDGGEMVEFLLENGANIEAHDYCGGSTPLLLALCLFSKNDVVPTLLQWNADGSARDNDGMTPLHYATLYFKTSDEEFAEELLENGADVNAADNLGRTPLHLAMNRNQTFRGEYDYFMAEFLLENGADVNAATNKGYTPLQKAFSNDRWDQKTTDRMFELLFKYGADDSVLPPSWRKEFKRIRAMEKRFRGPGTNSRDE
jgi:ankyrin repeat protein